MRINHNISALNTYRQYNNNTAAASKSMEKLSSGYRINRAADDAAGLSISEKMRSQIRGLTQANRNAQDGVSLIQTAEGALNEVSDMLTRIKELAVQVKNGTYSSDDKANIASEMTALGTAITNIYINTKFNGLHVFGAQDINGPTGMLRGSYTPPNTDVAAVITYGEDGGQSVTINRASTQKAATLLAETFYASNPNGAIPANPEGVTATDVEAAITEVDTTRAGYGAMQNQLEHASNNMAATQENLQAAESRVRDVDMASEMMEFTKNNILVQAAQAMLAQANSQPQGILQLLK